MNLFKYLQTLEPDKRIKVGAADGTSYFYIGTPADMIEKMEQYALQLNINSAETVQRAALSYKRAASAKILPCDYFMENMEDEKMQFSLEQYIKFLNAHIRLMNRKKNRYHRKKQLREQYVALPDRKIVDSFDCDPTADENIFAILVEGDETGKYWGAFEAEYIPTCKLTTPISLEDEDDDRETDDE